MTDDIAIVTQRLQADDLALRLALEQQRQQVKLLERRLALVESRAASAGTTSEDIGMTALDHADLANRRLDGMRGDWDMLVNFGGADRVPTIGRKNIRMFSAAFEERAMPLGAGVKLKTVAYRSSLNETPDSIAADDRVFKHTLGEDTIYLQQSGKYIVSFDISYSWAPTRLDISQYVIVEAGTGGAAGIGPFWQRSRAHIDVPTYHDIDGSIYTHAIPANILRTYSLSAFGVLDQQDISLTVRGVLGFGDYFTVNDSTVPGANQFRNNITIIGPFLFKPNYT